MQISARQIGDILNGKVEGNPDVLVTHPSKIEEGTPGSITFLANKKYEPHAYTTNASVLLVSFDFQPAKPIDATLVRVENVYESIAILLDKFGEQIAPEIPIGIAQESAVHPNATLGESVTVGRFTTIERGASVGSGSYIGANVYIGENVKIGKNCKLHPGVRIYHNCQLGDDCEVHSNSVIGADGFGFVPQEDGSFKKVVQIGNVVIGSHVEIGSCVTIDRATMGSTNIGLGVKIDNLVQIAHNVEIGAHTVIAAQAGVAGSTKIGKNCMIGGQVGFAGHLKIADGTRIQAQSGIASDVEAAGQALFGSPAMKYSDFIKSHAVFKKLPALYKKLHALEKELQEQKDKG